MDLLSAKELYFNNKTHTHAFYKGVLVWSKYNKEFSKDLNVLTDFEEWGGVYENTGGNLVTQKISETWGGVSVIDLGTEGYKVETQPNNTSSFGIKTSLVPLLKSGVEYVLSVDIKTRDISTLVYNYILSPDGNQGIGSIDLTKDGEWHRYKLVFTPNENKRETGILLASDLRKDDGRLFYAKNFYLDENKVDKAGGRLIV